MRNQRRRQLRYQKRHDFPLAHFCAVSLFAIDAGNTAVSASRKSRIYFCLPSVAFFPGTLANGDIEGVDFSVFICFGFLRSRLPRFSPLAILLLLPKFNRNHFTT